MYLGIDIGGTTARVSVFRTLDDVEEQDRKEFLVTQEKDRDFAEDFTNLALACESLAVRRGQIEGIGLALAGKLDAARSSLTGAGNLVHWVGQPVVARLAEQWDCPVVLGNDAEAAALAEAHYGHGQRSDFWFVIWGTGIGGCLLRHIDGRSIPLPGEIGHQLVDPRSDLLCGCGQYGCLEAHCGGSAIAKRFGLTAANLTAELWQEVVGWMKIGLHNAVVTQPTPLIVFGGGVANKQSPLLSDLEHLLQEELRIVDAPDIQLSAFGESAGTIGALALLR